MPDSSIIRVYKETEEAPRLHMHIFEPDRKRFTGPRPVVVFFFCGGWNGFSLTKMFPQSQYLISRGMVCFNAEVRVMKLHGTTPDECVVDGKSAIRWAREHAKEYTVDPEKIVASGGSASGHVSACSGILPGHDDPADNLAVSSQPNAMVLFNPVVDPTTMDKRIEKFGGKEKAEELSPILNVRPGLPPALILHGDADDVVLIDEEYRFRKKMEAAGNRCELVVYPGEGHGFFNYFDGNNKYFIETVREMDKFLASLGYLDGDPEIDSFEYEAPGW